MRRFVGACFVVASMLTLVLTRTGLDFIVHHDLEFYGLEFSYDWAQSYWDMMFLENLATGFMAFCVYMLNRPATKKNLTTGLLVAATFCLLVLNLDVLWFVIGGSFPAEDVVWWWMWPSDYGVTWTTSSQIIFTVALNVSVALLWIGWHRLSS